MNIALIILVALITITTQLILKFAIGKLAEVGVTSSNTIDFIWGAISSPYIWGAVLLQGTGFLLWLFVISRYKLGVAFAMSGAFFYVFLALAAWYFFNETLGTRQWAGIIIISLGVWVLTK